jgi:hypothetical protein
MGLHEICATFVQTELSNLSQHYTMICPGNVKVTLERYRDEIEDLSSRFVSAYIAHVTHIDGLGDIRRDLYETESSDQDSPNIRNETPRINLTKSEPGIMAASVVMLKITDAHGIVSSHSNYERAVAGLQFQKARKGHQHQLLEEKEAAVNFQRENYKQALIRAGVELRYSIVSQT